TARIVRRLIRSLDAAVLCSTSCTGTRAGQRPALDRSHAMPMPNLSLLARYAPRLWWWIRAMRLIGGTGMHRINHEASIHHAKRRIPADKRYGGVMAVTS